jgi:hypothetical protein
MNSDVGRQKAHAFNLPSTPRSSLGDIALRSLTLLLSY